MSRRRLLQALPVRPRLLFSPVQTPLSIDSARFYRVSASDDSSLSRRSSSSRGNKSLSQLVSALRTFHSLERHFAVPFSFVVPRSHNWPKDLHHLQLGVKVHRFMQSLSKGAASAMETKKQGAAQMQELRDMGFPLHSWQEYQFKQVCLPALQTYQEQYGDLFVPQKFVVPDDSEEAELWPRATRGYKLGLAVAKLRKQVQQQRQQEQQRKEKQGEAGTSAALPPLPKNQVEALNELGFVWRVRDTKWTRFFLPGLRKYKELTGTADVPLAFTIPSQEEDPRWPKALEGYMLGRHVYMVRSGKYATQVRDSKQELNELGFSFRLVDKVWGESIFPALGVFAAQYGHCDVWQDFVVPSGEPWPKDSWGLKLGDTVKNIRRGAYDSQVQAARKELDELGFVWNARHRVEKTVRSVVIPALVTYRRLHGNDALVTTDFVVPDRDPNWPVLARGFKLGQWITRARSGQVPLSPKLRAELDKIDFVWRSNDQRWSEVLLPAFQAYAELNGGTCASMSTKFSVPPEAPYPRAAWGVNLGGALWHIRNGDSYVNCEDKQRELRALGILADESVA
ncbi:hypothetical protein P3T76_011186 [Phytophthora citrophthora]|uniref:Helicase-associated domain-containing protein n=1 Tax=Phytophthora citrophthora TaxID=4793 RepID=A0AAD9GA36_9STRA|nr:hypothetical protein P3T76_011186 [Phytophthora citrophthora]